MTRTAPMPPKGTPRPRYVVSYTTRHGIRCTTQALNLPRSSCEQWIADDRAAGDCTSYMLAITSKGLRVRIGGGAK